MLIKKINYTYSENHTKYINTVCWQNTIIKYSKSDTYIFFFLRRCCPKRAMASVFRFLDHTQRGTTVGRTPLDEWSARRRSLYLHNQRKRRTSISSVGIEPAIPAIERLQTYTLQRTANRIGTSCYTVMTFILSIRIRTTCLHHEIHYNYNWTISR
jgi:hypothetical protein